MSDPVLCFLDAETTGPGRPDPLEDRIVELCIRTYPGRAWAGLVHPGDDYLPIPAERTEVHGITTEDVADRLTVGAFAAEWQRLIDAADYLVGYNLRRYDVPLLDKELRRCGKPGIDLEGVKEVDLYRVWSEEEPRSLEGAVRRFGAATQFGHDPHSAAGDVSVLPVLLSRMIYQFGYDPEDLPTTFEALAAVSRPEDEVDRAGRFRRDGETILLAFGKHEGQPAHEHPDYLRWMLGKDFPVGTKEWCRRLLERAP